MNKTSSNLLIIASQYIREKYKSYMLTIFSFTFKENQNVVLAVW